MLATGEPLLVTKDGKPLVKLMPAEAENDSIFGYIVEKAEIVGDIVLPAIPAEDWER